MGKGGKGERAGGGRRRRRGGGGRSPCRCLCDDFAPLRSFMSRKRKGVFRQGLDVSKDGLLSGPRGGVRRCRGSDVSWVGRSLGRGALATYGDPVGTGGREGRWMENGEQKLLEAAGVSRCAEGKLSLTDVCNAVLTSSHWCPSLSTVASAPIFTQTHNYETELSAPSLLRTSKAEAWAGVWSPTPAPPPASPLDSPPPRPPRSLISAVAWCFSTLSWNGLLPRAHGEFSGTSQGSSGIKPKEIFL